MLESCSVYFAPDAGPTMVRLVAKCRECGKRFNSLAFDKSKLDELKTKHVQDVFPSWPPADRELFFISGICGSCWDKIMCNHEAT